MAGLEAILHTQSRDLNYHPHIHVIMPGASIDKKTRLWRTRAQDHLFNQKALAKVFRAKLLQAIVDEKLLLPKNCPIKWVIHCKNVGSGQKALIYLGRYLYKGVISEKDILKCKNGSVTYRYLHARTKKYKTRTVSGEHFLYLLMLHILPKGFRRVRSYGFLHPCSKTLIRLLQLIDPPCQSIHQPKTKNQAKNNLPRLRKNHEDHKNHDTSTLARTNCLLHMNNQRRNAM